MKFRTPVLQACAVALALGSLSIGARALTLEEALRLAVSQHPTITTRQKELDAAKLRQEAAQRQLYPNLVLQSGKDYLGNNTQTYRLEQNLWTAGRVTAEIDGAGAGAQSAQSSVDQARQDIMDRVIQAYTDLGRTQARIEVARSNVQEHERLADLIARRVGGEVSPTSDGVMGLARLAQARAELGQMMALEARARSALAQALGQDIGNIVVPAQMELGFTDFNALLLKALDHSPALRRLAAEESAQQADVRAKESAYWPQLKLRADKTAGGVMPIQQTYLALEYQSGAGFATVVQAREAAARLEAAGASRETARRELIDRVSGDWADLQAYKLQMGDLRAQVSSSNEVFDSFVRQYSVGRKTWIDVLNAQRDVSQARYTQADVDWGMLRSVLKLQLATGTLSVQ